jgi:hypothetical protein
VARFVGCARSGSGEWRNYGEGDLSREPHHSTGVKVTLAGCRSDMGGRRWFGWGGGGVRPANVIHAALEGQDQRDNR